MLTFTQPELFAAVTRFEQNEAAMIADAKSAVVEWKYANEDMFGLFPLFKDIGFRYSGTWKPPKRRWYSKKPKGFFHLHGMDGHGNVQIIERSNGIAAVFVREERFIDEFFSGCRRPSLHRHVLENGRVVCAFHYHLDPHQYSREVFEYRGDKLIASLEESWYVSDKKWVKASWTTRCTYEYDTDGLIRAHRDGGGVSGNTLVFVRPNASQGPKSSRRPIVAYTVEVPDDPKDRKHQVYTDAYGLEMTIDDEWPIDTIVLVPADLVSVIKKETGLLTNGTVYAGASSLPANTQPSAIKKAGGTWQLIDATAPKAGAFARAALDAKLNLILSICEPGDLRPVLSHCGDVAAKRLVIAFRPTGECPPESGQSIAGRIRSEFNPRDATVVRILIAAPIGKDHVMDYLGGPNIDGLLHYGGNYGSTMEVLGQIALNRT